ncbi:hypothetical protein FGF1_30870 [Flavobacteriaceae bacterium GF1]
MPTFSSQLENKILYSNHDHAISVSYQSTYTLKYVVDGVKNYNYNNQDIAVSKNQYLLLNNDSHITTEVKKGTKGLSLFLSPELINEISHFYTNGNHNLNFLEVTRNKSNFQLSHLLNTMAYLYENNKTLLKERMDDLFIKVSELIVKEQVSINANFIKLRIVKRDTKRELYKRIVATKEYLNDNLQKKISLEALSTDIGISKYYLHRLFSEFNGETPNGYLTKIRLERAKNKLQTSKDPISEIAMACGFDDTAYFSNLFKKHTGLSPSRFRKSL